jgi:hypothetical protein
MLCTALIDGDMFESGTRVVFLDLKAKVSTRMCVDERRMAMS